MKLKYHFSFIEVDGNIQGVPIGENASEFNCVLSLNDVAQKMLQYIEEYGDYEKIYQRLLKDYPEDDAEDIKEKLDDYLLQLKAEGMLTD